MRLEPLNPILGCMTTTNPVATTEQIATAIELEARAERNRQSAEESFARCDTDGFATQIASRFVAMVDDAQARILRNGGMSKFIGLFSIKTGERVNAKVIDTKFGRRWAVMSADGRTVEKWLAYRPARASTLAKHGYVEAEEWAPAEAVLADTDQGYGCGVAIKRLDRFGGALMFV